MKRTSRKTETAVVEKATEWSDYMQVTRKEAKVSPKVMEVARTVASVYECRKASVYVSIEDLVSRVCMDRSKVERLVKEAVKAGLITDAKLYEGGISRLRVGENSELRKEPIPTIDSEAYGCILY